jgi:cytochrome b561
MTTERFSSVCLHVAAVLFHQFVLRDGTPERMLRFAATPHA